jgi:thiamine transport system ATP-binding protein
MLTLDSVHVDLGEFTLDATLTVETGRKVAILGPSGAGKSTLLAAIAGFQPATGRIAWNGEDLAGRAPADRPITTIFQDNNLFPHLNAAQNVGLGLRPDLRLSRADETQVEEALARVGLDGLGARKPARLSGGQAARVALARALLRHKPVMLLDEPFGALGPALRDEMLGLVRDLAAETGATLLMVSHEPEDAHTIADDVILVADGRAHAPVPTAEIFADPPEALRAYLGH